MKGVLRTEGKVACKELFNHALCGGFGSNENMTGLGTAIDSVLGVCVNRLLWSMHACLFSAVSRFSLLHAMWAKYSYYMHACIPTLQAKLRTNLLIRFLCQTI